MLHLRPHRHLTSGKIAVKCLSILCKKRDTGVVLISKSLTTLSICRINSTHPTKNLLGLPFLSGTNNTSRQKNELLCNSIKSLIDQALRNKQKKIVCLASYFLYIKNSASKASSFGCVFCINDMHTLHT